jgi:hypothetical protein
MSRESDKRLRKLADKVTLALKSLKKPGARDDPRTAAKQAFRSRELLDRAISEYDSFAAAVGQLDFNDDENLVWFELWNDLQAQFVDALMRTQAILHAAAQRVDDDAFTSGDDTPTAEGIAASLRIAVAAKATQEKDIERLKGVLRMTEELEGMANGSLTELQGQHERLQHIDATIRKIAKSLGRSESTVRKIKVRVDPIQWRVRC